MCQFQLSRIYACMLPFLSGHSTSDVLLAGSEENILLKIDGKTNPLAHNNVPYPTAWKMTIIHTLPKHRLAPYIHRHNNVHCVVWWITPRTTTRQHIPRTHHVCSLKHKHKRCDAAIITSRPGVGFIECVKKYVRQWWECRRVIYRGFVWGEGADTVIGMCGVWGCVREASDDTWKYYHWLIDFHAALARR